MPKLLASRIRPDTARSMREAASQRLEDARLLRSAGRPLAALYFFGYSTEMRVKAAYFRVALRAVGLDPDTTTIDNSRRRAAAREHSRLGMQREPGPRDIAGWTELLVLKRAAHSLRYPSPFEGEVQFQAVRLYDRWRETLRYHSNRPYSHELRVVAEVAEWFAVNDPLL